MSEDLRAKMQLHLSAINRRAKGIWHLSLYLRGAVPGLSSELSSAVVTYLTNVQSVGIDNPRRCLCCETSFRSDITIAGFSILTPGSDGDMASFVAGVCLTCMQRAGLRDAIRKVYREGLGIEIQVSE